MNRKDFLDALRSELKRQRKYNSEEIVFYYDELIQDAIDNGENERDFITRLGSVDNIAKQVSNDETFIDRVKKSNINSLKNILDGTVKLISNIVYAFLVFIIIVVGGSVLISGGALIIQSIVYTIVEIKEVTDYITLIGLILVGVGLIILGIELINQFIKFSNNLRYAIIRKTKALLDKKEGEKNE